MKRFRIAAGHVQRRVFWGVGRKVRERRMLPSRYSEIGGEGVQAASGNHDNHKSWKFLLSRFSLFSLTDVTNITAHDAVSNGPKKFPTANACAFGFQARITRRRSRNSASPDSPPRRVNAEVLQFTTPLHQQSVHTQCPGFSDHAHALSAKSSPRAPSPEDDPSQRGLRVRICDTGIFNYVYPVLAPQIQGFYVRDIYPPQTFDR